MNRSVAAAVAAAAASQAASLLDNKAAADGAEKEAERRGSGGSDFPHFSAFKPVSGTRIADLFPIRSTVPGLEAGDAEAEAATRKSAAMETGCSEVSTTMKQEESEEDEPSEYENTRNKKNNFGGARE